DWSSDVCSSDLLPEPGGPPWPHRNVADPLERPAADGPGAAAAGRPGRAARPASGLSPRLRHLRLRRDDRLPIAAARTAFRGRRRLARPPPPRAGPPRVTAP